MRPEWFRGKELLDIGCNEGLVTLAFATQLGCRRVLGVDIDGVLVNKACTNLRRMRTDVTEKYRMEK
jgi:7SK snRNA methylphosphate capping enzyme